MQARRRFFNVLTAALLGGLIIGIALTWTPPAEGKGKPGGDGGGGENPPAPPGYEISFLGTLGGPNSFAQAINSHGDVVGDSDTAEIEGRSRHHAFVSQLNEDGSRTMIDLHALIVAEGLIPPWDYENPTGSKRVTHADDVNDAGQILVYVQVAFESEKSAHYRYTPASEDENGPVPSRLELVAPLADGSTVGATAMNSQGLVTGHSNSPDGYHVFVWDGGATSIDLGTFEGRSTLAHDINALGQIAGGHSLVYRAWRFTPASGYESLGAPNGKFGISAANSINEAGEVAGTTYDGKNSRLFRYTDGVGRKDLGTLGGQQSFGGAINNFGDVLGSSETASGDVHLCLYTDQTGLFDLEAAITNLDPGIETLLGANGAGFNDHGEICTTARWADGSSEAYVLTPIAVP